MAPYIPLSTLSDVARVRGVMLFCTPYISDSFLSPQKANERIFFLVSSIFRKLLQKPDCSEQTGQTASPQIRHNSSLRLRKAAAERPDR